MSKEPLSMLAIVAEDGNVCPIERFQRKKAIKEAQKRSRIFKRREYRVYVNWVNYENKGQLVYTRRTY